ncbi:hypothetical protein CAUPRSCDRAFT_13015, partial [Caulochytrium protostelioides]
MVNTRNTDYATRAGQLHHRGVRDQPLTAGHDVGIDREVTPQTQHSAMRSLSTPSLRATRVSIGDPSHPAHHTSTTPSTPTPTPAPAPVSTPAMASMYTSPAPPVSAPIPPFKGKGGNARLWLRVYASTTKLSGWNDEHRLLGVLAYLQGEALEWAVEQNTALTWSDFERQFTERYAAHHGRHDALERLMTLRLHAEPSYSDFRHKFTTALSAAGIRDDMAAISMLYR